MFSLYEMYHSVIVYLGFNTLPDTVDYIIICIMIRCTGYHLKYIINKIWVIYHSVNVEETTPCLNIINMIGAIYGASVKTYGIKWS